MKVRSPEIEKTEGITLDDAVDDYFRITKNLRGFSNATISSYRTDFSQFARFLEKQKIGTLDVAAITPAQIEDFCLGLLEKKMSINTVHRKKDSLSSLFKHCVKRDWIVNNPVEKVEISRKRKNTRKVFLNKQQVQRFIAADVRIKGYSASTLKAVKIALCFTGLRNQELRKLNWENIDFDKNLIRIFDSKNTNRKSNPDNLDREVPICTCLRNALKEIEAIEGPVFKNSKGTVITKDALKSLVGRSAQSIEVKISLTPHGLRHSLSSNLEKEGATQSDIALLLGHIPNSTTEGYVHSNLERISELLEEYSVSVMEVGTDENMDDKEGNFIRVNKEHPEPSCDIQRRRNIIINCHEIIDAERVWNEINGDKCMPASFLLGYILKP